jgi:hypothetical protein
MVGVGQAATPETVAIKARMVRVEVEQAAVFTVLRMVILVVAVWDLLGKVVREFSLTMRLAAVLAEKHLQQKRTHF